MTGPIDNGIQAQAACAAPENTLVLLARTELYSAVISDALDAIGLFHQTMSNRVRPLDEAQVLCGRARTGDYRDIYSAEDSEDHYERVVSLVDTLAPDDVIVMACGGSERIHPWGATQAMMAKLRGAAGCVTDGLIRDVRQLRELGLPSFAAGYGALRMLGRCRMIASDVPVTCGGVWVSPGDLVFGDVDGIVVVPRGVEEQVVHDALARAARERELVSELRSGVSITELYRKYRTL